MALRILVGLLIVCGVGGLALVLIASLKTDPAPTASATAPIPPPPVVFSHVLAAGRPVRAGTLLMIDDLTTRDIPSGQEPAGSFPDTIGDRDRLRGAMVRRSLSQSDIIVNADVLRPGDRGFLAAVLCAGMRAVTVGVDPISGTAGLIWPGDRVDIVLTQSAEERDQPVDRRVFSETVLTDLRAIAVDQQLVQGGQANAGNPNSVAPANRTITLEASPYDAERITTAARLGKLSLVVRSAAGEGDSEANAETLIKGACPATRQQPIGGAPIAWGGDVSPALRDHSGAKSGAVVRMYIGPKVAEEVKF